MVLWNGNGPLSFALHVMIADGWARYPKCALRKVSRAKEAERYHNSHSYLWTNEERRNSWWHISLLKTGAGGTLVIKFWQCGPKLEDCDRVATGDGAESSVEATTCSESGLSLTRCQSYYGWRWHRAVVCAAVSTQHCRCCSEWFWRAIYLAGCSTFSTRCAAAPETGLP